MLTSERFASSQRLQQASHNSPAVHIGESGDGVARLEQALYDLGWPLPKSMAGDKPDGKFGQELFDVVKRFQYQQGLKQDGIVGKKTLSQMDLLFGGPFSYTVPGFKVVLKQTGNLCWAAVNCMMRSWKYSRSEGIREAAAAVDEKYGLIVDSDKGLLPSEFKPFITKAGMQYEPMESIPLAEYVSLMKQYGLLWIGTLASVNGTGLHSRIIEGVIATSTGGELDARFSIIDPAYGARYYESFRTFLKKYEGAAAGSNGEYYQIRHF